MTTRYFSGQGKVYLSLKDGGGNPTGFSFLGNTPALDFAIGRAGERYATGGGTPYGLVRGSGSPVISLTIDELTKDNLAKALWSAVTSVAGNTVANEVLTSALGKTVPLANINLSSFTSLTDLGGGTTYVNGTDYTANLKAGSITFPASGSAIGDAASLKANYVFGAYDKIPAFTTVQPYYWLRFEGINTADGDSPCIVDAYKVKVLPASGLSFINDALSAVQFVVPMHYDSTRGGTDGYFFRIRQTP